MPDIRDLTGGQCGDINPPGVLTTVYVVCLADVDTIPDPVGGPLLGDAKRITDDIVLLPNKKWARFEIITDTGELKHVQVGVTGSRSFQQMLEYKLQDTGPDAAEWVEKRANGCFIALVEEKKGFVRLMGGIGIPVQQESAEGTSGKDSESETTWTNVWKGTTGLIAPYYEGVIDVDDQT